MTFGLRGLFDSASCSARPSARLDGAAKCGDSPVCPDLTSRPTAGDSHVGFEDWGDGACRAPVLNGVSSNGLETVPRTWGGGSVNAVARHG